MLDLSFRDFSAQLIISIIASKYSSELLRRHTIGSLENPGKLRTVMDADAKDDFFYSEICCLKEIFG